MIRTCYLILCGLLLSGAVHAQSAASSYPKQVVRIVVPTTAGGVSDLLARAIADKLGVAWKQAVIVENRPGLAGVASVAKSPPDGYTLMLTGNGHSIINAINQNLPFDAIKDFTGVAQVASVPFVLLASQRTPADDLQGVLALARARPGSLNLATPGQGTSASILAELFRAETGIDVTEIPFKGAPDAHLALQRGDIDLHFSAAHTSITLTQSGKAKAIAVAADSRVDALPQVPTMAEAGLPRLRYDGWFGLLAPAGTPQAIREKIHAEVSRILGVSDLRTALQAQGFVVRVTGPAQFDAAMRTDAERYSRFFKRPAK